MNSLFLAEVNLSRVSDEDCGGNVFSTSMPVLMKGFKAKVFLRYDSRSK